MQHIVYEKFGPPAAVAKCVEVADPGPPAAWEVLVKVDAFSINPADVAMLQGQYGILNNPPSTIGMEGVGTVVEVGQAVTKLEMGDRVILLGNNNWATHRRTPATLAVKVPRHLDPLQLSMLKVSGLTAYWLLFQSLSLEREQFIVQNAPLSAVGRYVLQLAKTAGIRSVNLVRRPEQLHELARLGGDINLVDHDDVGQELRTKLGSGALRLGLDAVAGNATNRLATCLSEGATIINYGMLSMQPCQLEASQTIFRNIRLEGFWLSKVLNRLSAQDREAHLLKLVELLSSGSLSGAIDSTYSIDRIGEALRRAEQPGRNGKVVVSMAHETRSTDTGSRT